MRDRWVYLASILIVALGVYLLASTYAGPVQVCNLGGCVTLLALNPLGLALTIFGLVVAFLIFVSRPGVWPKH